MLYFIDILDGDIKSILDILWLTILNYGIHNIGKYPRIAEQTALNGPGVFESFIMFV